MKNILLAKLDVRQTALTAALRTSARHTKGKF